MNDASDNIDEIGRYERMSSEQIADELRRFGIDPQATIDAVTELVQTRLEDWRERGILPPKKP